MGLLSTLFGPKKPEVLPTPVRDMQSFRSEVLQSDRPVIVDVWGANCAPCKQLVPVLVGVATRHQARVKVVEISTESEPALLGHLGVRSTPTILVFEGGAELGREVGYRPGSWFDQMIEAEFASEEESS